MLLFETKKRNGIIWQPFQYQKSNEITSYTYKDKALDQIKLKKT